MHKLIKLFLSVISEINFNLLILTEAIQKGNLDEQYKRLESLNKIIDLIVSILLKKDFK